MATIKNSDIRSPLAFIQRRTADAVGLALNVTASVVGAIGTAMILSGTNCNFNGESCVDVAIGGNDVSDFFQQNLGVSGKYQGLLGVVTLFAAKKLSNAGNAVANMQFTKVVEVQTSKRKRG